MEHSTNGPRFDQRIWEFESFQQYQQLLDALLAEVGAGRITETAVDGQPRYWNERWFRLPQHGIWRLASPDSPFRGVWEPV